jgi:hypothetical protein
MTNVLRYETLRGPFAQLRGCNVRFRRASYLIRHISYLMRSETARVLILLPSCWAALTQVPGRLAAVGHLHFCRSSGPRRPTRGVCHCGQAAGSCIFSKYAPITERRACGLLQSCRSGFHGAPRCWSRGSVLLPCQHSFRLAVAGAQDLGEHATKPPFLLPWRRVATVNSLNSRIIKRRHGAQRQERVVLALRARNTGKHRPRPRASCPSTREMNQRALGALVACL